MSNRLNITFNNKEIIDKIELEAINQNISKSQLIESVMREYLDLKNIKLNNIVEQYLYKYIHLGIIDKKTPLSNDNDNHFFVSSADVLLRESLYINYRSNSISISELNKLYSRKIRDRLYIEQKGDKVFYKCDGMFYVVLIRRVYLLELTKINYDLSCNNTTQRKKINNKKYHYKFEVSYVLIKIGKIIAENKSERKNPTYHLKMLSDRNPFISEKLFKRIDFSSIEYRTPKESEILSMKKSKRTCDYYPLIPAITTNKEGGYYVKLSNKAKSINQYRKCVFKDNSFFNILPIINYVKSNTFNENLLTLDAQGNVIL